MRIKKGSRVEVWSQETPPMGAWSSGEVRWGNGHSYHVQFDHGDDRLLGIDALPPRIPRKCVRPCPPAVPLPDDLAAGDMVEVFDDSVWKCAEVARAGGDGQFDVKVVGSPKVIQAGPRDLRVRQVLRNDDVWVVLHKDNQIPGAKPLPPHKAVKGGKRNGNGGGKSVITPSFKWGMQKRTRCLEEFEIIGDGRIAEGNSKRICVEEEETCQFEAQDVKPDLCLNKQEEMSSDECDVVGTDTDNDDNDDDCSKSVSSSVGSSGSSSNGDRVVSTSRPCDDHNANQLDCPKDHSDDRTGSNASVRRHMIAEEGVVAGGHVHHLQLEAYNALMRAFYASGPLSWEQEGLLTSLRQHLNISSDEHLQVIREVLRCKRNSGNPGKF